jgi:UTP--glucose-1-phosphate uridylyltransferase
MRVRKAVFPAAGLGTRFLPATKAQPKEMLPIVDKPIIQYVVEEAVQSGIQDVIIVTGRGKNAIEDHFDRSMELEAALMEKGRTDLVDQIQEISSLISVCYIRQKEPLGLGHAILVTRNLVGDEPFAVFLGDDIIDSQVPCMAQMMQVFEQYGDAVLAVQEVPRPEVRHYGVIDGVKVSDRVFEIKDMVEKPNPEEAPSNLAIIGRYILPPSIFALLEETPPDAGGEIQLTNALRALLKHRPVYGYQFEGKRYDAGNKLGFLKATVEFALKRPDLAKEFSEYLRSLKIFEAGSDPH